MALVAAMASTASAADAGVPRKNAGTYASASFKSHAAPTAATQMQRARRLASTKGFFTQAVIPPLSRAASSDASLPELYGSVIYADGWTQQVNEVGMYRIGTSDATPFTRMGSAHVDASSGGVAIGNDYYASHSVNMYGSVFAYTSKYDATTWAEDTKWDY